MHPLSFVTVGAENLPIPLVPAK